MICARSRPTGAWLPALLCLAGLLGGSLHARDADPYVEDSGLTFAFLDLEGRTVRSSDPEFAGKVLFVDLWGTWCPPCIGEIPTFIDLQEKLGERGLVIIAVAFESEDEESASRRDRLRAFVKEQGINYLVLDGQEPRDSDQAFPGLRNVKGFPVEILIGRDGRVVDVRNGYAYSKRWARRLERELVELLTEPAEAKPIDRDGD
jgi:thiol-disulfide isomerase/thioredoxin